MRKIGAIFGLSLLLFSNSLALAERAKMSPQVRAALDDPNFANPRKLDEATQLKLYESEIMVFCSRKGREFAEDLIGSLHESLEKLTSQSKTSPAEQAAVRASAESLRQEYSSLCEKSVVKAIAAGLSEQRAFELVRSQNK